MALKKAEERDKKMLDLLKEWKSLEEETIDICARISKKSKNPIIKILITAIKNDSKKHRSIIKLISNSMTKKAFVLIPDDLVGVSGLLNKHIAIEQKSIDTANEAIEMSRDATVKHLLRFILEDEKQHEKLLDQMNKLKFMVTARVT
ncbi:MAG: ferritin-like domain-containing protein [Thermodesulfovibrionia bacterium]